MSAQDGGKGKVMLDLRVMVVEDEAFLLASLEKILKREVREVHAFSNPNDALEAFETLQPDVIISDVKMPGIDGLEMVKRIREKAPDIHVIIASAFNDPAYFQRAIRLHVDNFLIKPIIVDLLLETLSRIAHSLQTERDLQLHMKLLDEYKTIVDVSNHVAKTDPTGKITYINDRFSALTGYTREELLGKPIRILRHPDTPKSLFQEMWQTITAKQTWRGILKDQKKSGEPFYVSMTISPILGVDDNIIEFISINQDITPVMLSLQQQQQINTLKDDFLRNISHEVKTPVNIIAGASSLLAKKVKEPKLLGLLRQIDDASNELTGLINSVVDLSQLSSGSYNLAATPTVIYDNLVTLLESCREQADRSDIELHYQIDEALQHPFACDMKLIAHVINALVNNAIKFNSRGGKAAVKINIADQKLQIQVKDNGIGIAPDKQHEIFELFHQLDGSTTRHHEGLGIGLALTQLVVERVGGSVHVDSTEGKGSLFTVTLDFNQHRTPDGERQQDVPDALS